MRGYVSGQTARNGTIAFSTTNYWYSNGLKSEYGTSYPAYVYDSNSTMYTHIENYKNIIEQEYGVDVVEARPIKYEELTHERIGCSAADYTCTGAPEFIYSTSYWSGSAAYTYDVWRVDSDGSFVDGSYDIGLNNGLRPVIVISKSLF